MHESMAFASSLIFLYGFIILVYKGFKEGYQESLREK
ncbi:MAG: hypothetical protein OD815_000697 [Candidatus Alkanophagales archaeon MCA70_species_2]|nr:hypothetical protein [Candidatus Alkanophaga liquidiphilum]